MTQRIRVNYWIDLEAAKAAAREAGELPPAATSGTIDAGHSVDVSWDSALCRLRLEGPCVMTAIDAVKGFEVEVLP